MNLNELKILYPELIENVEDPLTKALMQSCMNKKFYEISFILQSDKYISTFLFLPNKAYKFMLEILFFAIEDYVEELHIHKDKDLLNKSIDFRRTFNWFFNSSKEDYIANFVFICDQIRIPKQLILLLLIKLTRQCLKENDNDYGNPKTV